MKLNHEVSVKKKSDTSRPPKLSRQFLRDEQWISDHIQELIGKYPNQWIMVYKANVIAHGEQVWSMWRMADELGLGQPVVSFVERDVHVY